MSEIEKKERELRLWDRSDSLPARLLPTINDARALLGRDTDMAAMRYFVELFGYMAGQIEVLNARVRELEGKL